MSERQETIADIVAEMRYGPIPQHRRDQELLRHYADRLETAWKREKAAIEADALAVGGLVEASRATTEKSSAVGDSAKLREALGKLRAELWNNTVIAGKKKNALYEIADAALAAPPRNCDIGTVDEQTERFVDFTRLYFQSEMVRLAMNWAQMPYKEGGDK